MSMFSPAGQAVCTNYEGKLPSREPTGMASIMCLTPLFSRLVSDPSVLRPICVESAGLFIWIYHQFTHFRPLIDTHSKRRLV